MVRLPKGWVWRHANIGVGADAFKFLLNWIIFSGTAWAIARIANRSKHYFALGVTHERSLIDLWASFSFAITMFAIVSGLLFPPLIVIVTVMVFDAAAPLEEVDGI